MAYKYRAYTNDKKIVQGKIEVASARIEEIKKQVNDLEKQRNNAILFNLLNEEENKLSAHRLTVQINTFEGKLKEIDAQISHRARHAGVAT